MKSRHENSSQSILENLTNNALSILEPHSTKHHFKKGDDIIYKGQEIGGVYIVKNGALRVYTIDSNGNEKPIYRLHSNEVCVFSINCVLKEIIYPAWVTVESDSATILSIPTLVFRKLYEDELSIREYIMNALSNRIFDLMDSIEEASIYETADRINNYLLRNCPNNKILKMSHQDIATNIGTAREVVSRHLKKLEKQHWVKLSHRQIEIIAAENIASNLKKEM